MNKFKNNNGYVALISVLIVSAMGTIITISFMVTSILYQRSSFSLEQGYSSIALAKTCSNIALENIRRNTSYDGNEIINLGNYYCNILSIIKNEDRYTINTIGIAGLSEKKNRVVVIRTENPDTFDVQMSIESWKEVVDF